jgi:predicted transcriptional regulator
MAKTIEELENDLGVMNEMFRKYVKLSLNYQQQINNADIPEEQRKALMEKLEVENEKVRKAKEQMAKFEKTIESLKQSNDKLKEVASCKEETVEYLVAYN